MDTNTPRLDGPWRATAPNTNAQVTHGKLRFLTQLIIPGVILLMIAVGMITGYLEKWL